MSGADLEVLVAVGKRFIVLHGNETHGGAPTRDGAVRGRNLLEALRHQALLNARMFDADRRALLTSNYDALAGDLLNADFTQRETGDLLCLSQSSVSRRNKQGVTPAPLDGS
jgi:hypothetical protein